MFLATGSLLYLIIRAFAKQVLVLDAPPMLPIGKVDKKALKALWLETDSETGKEH